MASVVQIASPFFFVFVFKIFLLFISSSEIYLAWFDEDAMEDDEDELDSKVLLLLMMMLMMASMVVDVRLYRV